MREGVYGVIYVATCIVNGKQYVGQTKEDPANYWKIHLQRARNGKKKVFYSAIRKHGTDSFVFEVIFVAFDKLTLDLAEDYFIIEWGTMTPHGYNMKGGGATGKLSKETRDTLRRINIAHFSDPKVRDEVRQRTLAQFADPDKRARHRAAYDNPDTKVKLSAIGSDTEWYNDGTTGIRVHPGDPIPEGFVSGQIYRGDRAASQAKGKHVRWHVNRGIIAKDCEHCAELSLRWANDGITEAEFSIGDPLPKGWKPGLIVRKAKARTNNSMTWITDGVLNQMITADASIPDGWKIGMTKDRAAATHARWHVARDIFNKDCHLCQEIIAVETP